MTTDRFSAIDDGIYATCTACSLDLPTEAEANSHMSTTFEESQKRKGHRIRVYHRSRADWIESAVSLELDRALQHLFQEVDELVLNGDITEREAFDALRTLNTDLENEYEMWREQ